jgi:hypothetical protein
MATPKVDLTNCDGEPIHVPGAVQPHGLLLACRGDAFTIVQASDNSAAVVGQAPAALLGTSIAAILSPESWQRSEDPGRRRRAGRQTDADDAARAVPGRGAGGSPSGFEALELLTAWKPDVIVWDVGMPEMAAVGR